MIALHFLVTSVGAALGVFYPFISVILAGRGFSPSEIGLVFSLGAVGFTLALPAWGHLADVGLGRRRTLILCAVGAGAAVAAGLFATPPPVIAVLLIMFWVFESSWQPLADAITVNALAGRDYARIRLFGSLGFGVGAIGSGFVYDALDYDAAFVFFAAASAVLAVSAAFVPDVGRADLDTHRRRASDVHGDDPDRHQRPRLRVRLGSTGVAFGVAPRLGLVLVATTLLHIGIIAGFTFLPLRIETLGGSPADVALSAGLSALFEVPAMLVMGALARRTGLRAIFMMAALLYSACMVSWMVIDIPAVIVATRALTGLAFSGVVVAVVLTIAEILPADLQATGQSLFQTSAFGIAAIVANIAGGVLYEALDAQVFGLGAILAVAAAAIAWFAFPSRGPFERPPDGTMPA